MRALGDEWLVRHPRVLVALVAVAGALPLVMEIVRAVIWQTTPAWWLMGLMLPTASVAVYALTRIARRIQVLTTTLDHLPSAVAVYDSDDRLIYFNELYTRFHGALTESIYPGARYGDLVALTLGKTTAIEDVEHEVARRVAAHRAADGTVRDWPYPGGLYLRVQKRWTEGGINVGVGTDITELYRTRATLQAEAERFSALASNMPVGLCQVSPSNEVTYANPALLRIFNAPDLATLLEDQTAFDVDGTVFTGVAALLMGVRQMCDRTIVRARFGADRHLSIHSAHFQESGGNTGCALSDAQALCIVFDETDRVRAEAKVHHLAMHDALTGARNRAAFACDLNAAADGASAAAPLAVIAVDLDGFKPINDLHGHAAGDRLLQEVVARLSGGETDARVVYRLGGDEFALLMEGTDGPAALAAARAILATLLHPYEDAGNPITVGASVGVSLLPLHAADTARAVDFADRALYRVKAAGGHDVALFDPTMLDEDAVPARRRSDRPRTAA